MFNFVKKLIGQDKVVFSHVLLNEVEFDANKVVGKSVSQVIEEYDLNTALNLGYKEVIAVKEDSLPVDLETLVKAGKKYILFLQSAGKGSIYVDN